MKLALSKGHTFLLLLLAVLCIAACRQDPVFYAIWKEPELRDPRIPGSPSNMVIFERKYTHTDPDTQAETERSVQALYVGSNSLHWYSKPATESERADPMNYWDNDAIERGSVPQPGGTIAALAATGTHLYALCESSGARVLKRIGQDEQAWERIPSPSGLRTIFASGDKVFAGQITYPESAPSGALYYIDEHETSLIKLADTGSALLYAAAFDGMNYEVDFDDTHHYFCLKDIISSGASVIYRISADNFPAGATNLQSYEFNKSDTNGFMSLVSLENGTGGTLDTIIAVDENGQVFTSEDGGAFTTLGTSMGSFSFSGALGVFTDVSETPPTTTLLVGYKSYSLVTSGSNYGYREFKLPDGGYSEPTDITSQNIEQYYSTLGQRPVSHIFQAPASVDDSRTLFAATSGHGLWSYRFRDSEGESQWNAEE